MRRFARENGLSLFFATIFLATLVGQSFAGQHNSNAEQAAHKQPAAPSGHASCFKRETLAQPAILYPELRDWTCG